MNSISVVSWEWPNRKYFPTEECNPHLCILHFCYKYGGVSQKQMRGLEWNLILPWVAGQADWEYGVKYSNGDVTSVKGAIDPSIRYNICRIADRWTYKHAISHMNANVMWMTEVWCIKDVLKCIEECMKQEQNF